MTLLKQLKRMADKGLSITIRSANNGAVAFRVVRPEQIMPVGDGANFWVLPSREEIIGIDPRAVVNDDIPVLIGICCYGPNDCWTPVGCRECKGSTPFRNSVNSGRISAY